MQLYDFTIKKIVTAKFVKFSDLWSGTQEEFLECEGDEAKNFKFFRYDDILFNLEEFQVMDPDFRLWKPVFGDECPTHWGRYQGVTGRNYYILIRELDNNRVMVGKVDYC